MPSTNCSSIQEESTLDQHSPVHEIFNYLTATFPVHHYPEPPERGLTHPFLETSLQNPDLNCLELHLNIVMPGISCDSWERGVLNSPKVRPQPTEGLDLLLGLRGHGWGNFCHQDSLALRLLCTSLCQVQSISRLDMHESSNMI